MFVEISLIVIIAAVAAYIFERLRQPTILAYLFSGMLVAWWGLGHDSSLLLTLKDMGSVGVVLLLFLVGMELSIPRVQSVGKAALIVGLGQIFFTVGMGWLFAYFMGYSFVSALYLSVALAFSSTVVVVKLFNQLKILHSLHGKIAVGFLLVQDLAAILILVLLSAFKSGELTMWLFILTAVKSLAFFFLVWWMSTYGIPRIVKSLHMSSEVLFLFSIAWGLGVAAFMTWEPIGFTIEAGGFLAGIMLANTLQHNEILSRARPLRDFFVMFFFVVLGIEMGVSLTTVSFSWLEVLFFSSFVLIGNPLIVLVLMWMLGYRPRTGFFVSLAVAQVSEFSLILVAVGQSLGHVDSAMMGSVTFIAVITFLVSGYLILHSQKIWLYFAPWLKSFQRKRGRTLVNSEIQWKKHAVLIGCHRTGSLILKQLEKLEIPCVVLDYDPDIVETLTSQGRHAVLGDIDDVEVYEAVSIEKAAIIISTVSDMAGSKILLEYLQHHSIQRNQVIILTISTINEAYLLYELGAHYVNVPRAVSGWHVGQFIQKAWEEESPREMQERGLKELDKLSRAAGI